MPNNTLPARVRHLILNYVPSVLQLEILLHLFGVRPRFVELAELVRQLRIDASPLATQLADMRARGVVASSPDGGQAFAYAAAYAEQDEAMAELAGMYRTYRVSIINLIYSRPAESIRTFADAFRLKKKPEEAGDE